MTEEVKNLEFMAAYMEGDILYGAGLRQNILFQYDMKRKSLKRLGSFTGFKNICGFSICEIIKYGRKLYCFSKNSYEVAVYHLNEHKFTYYGPNNERKEGIISRCVCRIGNNVWIFGEATASSIMVFSMESERYYEYKVDTSILNKYDFSFSIGSETCVYLDKYIWRCLPGNSVLLAYNTEEVKLKVIELDARISAYTISCIDKKLLVLDRKGKQILLYEPDTNKTMLWGTGYLGQKDKPFREVLCRENRLFLLPGFEDEIYYYEICENKILFKGYIDYPINFKRLHCIGQRGMFLGYFLQSGKKLYLFPFCGNGMFYLNINSFETKFYPIQISEEDYIVGGIEANMVMDDRQVKINKLIDYIKGVKKNREKDKMWNNKTKNKFWERLNNV